MAPAPDHRHIVISMKEYTGYAAYDVDSKDANENTIGLAGTARGRNSNTSTGAEITIGSKHPRVPSVVGGNLTQATSALTAAGFVRGTVSFAVDGTCNNIGRVMSQNPSGGNHHPAGTAVRLTIGNPPSHPCP